MFSILTFLLISTPIVEFTESQGGVAGDRITKIVVEADGSWTAIQYTPRYEKSKVESSGQLEVEPLLKRLEPDLDALPPNIGRVAPINPYVLKLRVKDTKIHALGRPDDKDQLKHLDAVVKTIKDATIRAKK